MDTFDGAPQLPGFSTPLRVFGTSRAGVRESLVWSCALTVTGLGLLIGGLVAKSVAAKPAGGIVAAIGGCAALLFALVFALNLVWLKGRRIWLFPEGIVDGFRGRFKACRWDEVEEIVHWTSIDDLAMRKADGRQVDFGLTTIEGAGDLAEAVVARVKADLARRLVTRIRSGETVRFGRIDATKAGITIHYKAHRSDNPKSFYQGPWPRGDRRKDLAKGHDRAVLKLRWDEINGVEEDGRCDVFIRTRALVPLHACPGDLPNSIVLPDIARALAGSDPLRPTQAWGGADIPSAG